MSEADIISIYEPNESLSAENVLWIYAIDRMIRDLLGFAGGNDWGNSIWVRAQKDALKEYTVWPDHFHEIVFERTGLSAAGSQMMWTKLQQAATVARNRAKSEHHPLRMRKRVSFRSDSC